MRNRISDADVALAARREATSKLMDAENRHRKAAQALEKAKASHAAAEAAYKYFSEPKAAAPSPTDTTDHNGKYFQNVSAGKPTIEKC